VRAWYARTASPSPALKNTPPMPSTLAMVRSLRARP
jgi:hypothetical protein